MKKILGIILVSVLLVGCITGCQTDKSNKDKADSLTIGFMNTNLSNEFQVAMLDAARESADEMGITLAEQDGQGDAAKQVSQMEQLISQKVDAIVMAPYDKDACAPAVTKAKEAGIPLVIVNSTVNNMDQATAYVGSDDKVAGEIAMKELAEAIGEKGNIMMIRGPIGNSAEVGRTEGVNAVLEEYSEISIVVDEPANWDREKAMKLMENKLQDNLNIIGVMAQNDEMAIGAQKAIEAAGKQDDIKVIGIDAIADALTAVEEDRLIATVFQDARAQAKKALEVAVSAAKGEDTDREYFIDFQLITKENVADYK
ncbi:inositol transport system substrate-binding protein [Aequitasia blattaphilus]|uniref:Substrate-binding domain-containing protein n=1 Tax=Aequitasia blattaphilus TaxID=2949332 RepID=A0ABT1ECD0_9FIRM|nr:substrate-binding domain-containing protein [Aequitasia blattaphilus]MCP1103493.1 substrate-binding domain-containing protein [Aequitasia blattaphilus]MCR8616133.1 substrate-binding domain-containing protein [Aequitasia blattaphilus]